MNDQNNAWSGLGAASAAALGMKPEQWKGRAVPTTTVYKDLLSELKSRRDRASTEAHHCENRARDLFNAVADYDRAIAALEPAPEPCPTKDELDRIAPGWDAPETQAPTSSPSTDEARSVPGAEENAGTNLDEPAEFISILTGDPAIEPESGLHADPEPTELDAPASIVDDPELLAAVARAEATLAQEEPAYVGLQDPELDAEYKAMREREKADKPKLHFSIFGERGNRKLEDVE